MLRNQRGSILVEAAILYPLFFLIAAVLIQIILLFYISISIKSNIDLKTLRISGNLAGVVETEDQGKKEDYTLINEGLYKAVEIRHENNSYGFGLLNRNIKRTEISQYAIIDEADILRKASVLEDWVNEISDK